MLSSNRRIEKEFKLKEEIIIVLILQDCPLLKNNCEYEFYPLPQKHNKYFLQL
jgi:hypothetical protein